MGFVRTAQETQIKKPFNHVFRPLPPSYKIEEAYKGKKKKKSKVTVSNMSYKNYNWRLLARRVLVKQRLVGA